MVTLSSTLSVPEQASYNALTPILIVGHTHRLCETLSSGLRAMGFKNITLQDNSFKALDQLEEEEYSFLFLEQKLDFLCGLEFLTEIRQRVKTPRRLSIIFGQAPLETSVLQKFPETSMDGYIRLPCLQKELLFHTQKAIKNFEHTHNVEMQFEQARVLYLIGDYLTSYEIYKEISCRKSSWARPFLGMALCQNALGHVQDAEQNLSICLQNNPKHTQAYLEMGAHLLSCENVLSAYTMFQHALQHNPRLPWRYLFIAERFMTMNLLTDAERYLVQAIALNIRSYPIYALLGKCYVLQKKTKKAIDFLELARLYSPHNISLLNSLGFCYKEQRQFDYALSCYNKILKNHPLDFRILYNKSLCFFAMKDFIRAKKLCEKILEINPNFEKASNKLNEILTLLEGDPAYASSQSRRLDLGHHSGNKTLF